MREHALEQEGVAVLAEAAGEGLLQHQQLGPELAPGELRHGPGISHPSMRARIMSRPEAPMTSLATLDSLTPASSRVLWMRLTSEVRSLVNAFR